MFVHELITLLQTHCDPGDRVYIQNPYDEDDDDHEATGIDALATTVYIISTTRKDWGILAPSTAEIENACRRDYEALKAQRELDREEALRLKFEKHGMDYAAMKKKLP